MILLFHTLQKLTLNGSGACITRSELELTDHLSYLHSILLSLTCHLPIEHPLYYRAAAAQVQVIMKLRYKLNFHSRARQASSWRWLSAEIAQRSNGT